MTHARSTPTVTAPSIPAIQISTATASPNGCDIDQTGGADCDLNGEDDSCQPDTDLDGTIDPCDPDIDGDGIPNDCDVDQTGGADCDLNGEE